MNKKDKSNRNLWTSAALAGGCGRLGLASCAAILFVLAGCTTAIPRLDAKFDADPVGTLPIKPLPNPPNDDLGWRTGLVSSTLVSDSAAGKLVRVAPLPAFAASPDNRAVFLIAVTEPFTTSPAANIRGHVKLRLINPGTVGFGLRPLQAEQTLDFIGGVELSNFLPPSGGGVNVVQPFSGGRIDDIFPLPSGGTISGYTPGDVIDINWSIDQAARIFYATATRGAPQSVSFPAFSGGNATTPIQRLSIQFWMQRPTTDTVLFIDDLLAEEYR